MRLRSLSVLLLGFVLASAGSALAQVSTTGTIQVIVEDQQGGRLPGVTVVASANDVVTTRQAVSDAEGVATLEALAPSDRYVITGTLAGFRDFNRAGVLVRSGQTATIHAQLGLATVTEVVTVQGVVSQTVDITRAVAGQDITLQLTESLPTGRSYQSYLQLVPGVMPDSPNAGGNPSSRSGMNWKDVVSTDNMGMSTDNFYYFEGINVTDPVSGTFGANLNTEIIQEQKVITGGIPAEYVGSAGLISTVITKSGSNKYSGSYNYFFQKSSFVAADEHNPATTFNTKDTAFTLGGPVAKDKLWAFGSFRYTNRLDAVSAQDTHLKLRDVTTTQKQGFAKATYVPTRNDLLSIMFLNDPFERDNSTSPIVANNRGTALKQGGNNYSATYNRVWGRLLIDGAFNKHDAELSTVAADRTARNTVSFQKTAVRTLADEQLGGAGSDFPETRPTIQGKVSMQYQWGEHRFKAGLEWAEHKDLQSLLYIPSTDPAQYTSISSQYLGTGVTAASLATSGRWSTSSWLYNNKSDFDGFIGAINALPNRAAFYSAYDTNGDGTISQTELGQALVFNSTAGNPNGQIDYYRIVQAQAGPLELKVHGTSLFGQDEFRLNRWTFNFGVRAERWTHIASTGATLYSFPWTVAPRLSAVYDISGDGSQKLSAYFGRYYDPIRMDMTGFAGTLSSSIRDEQIFANGQWVTYRTRGGPVVLDSVFAATAKTPYTDELQIQYEKDLARNMSVSATYYHRQTRDIFEDFDGTIYANAAGYGGDINAPNSLFLGWGYFGYTDANHPNANYYQGTLKGGERNYNGVELVLRKRFSDRWQGLFSYNYLDAKGNAVSDGNADFAGDVFWLDPRAPNVYGTMPGTIHNLLKAAGSYTTKWGLELGGTYMWNSGTIVNKSQLMYSRRLPIQVTDPYEFGGISDYWLAPDARGTVQNPSWGSVNARVQYIRPIQKVTAEFFVDIFNLFNAQSTMRNEDLVAGTGSTQFGDAIQWVTPRRAFLGARVRF